MLEDWIKDGAIKGLSVGVALAIILAFLAMTATYMDILYFEGREFLFYAQYITVILFVCTFGGAIIGAVLYPEIVRFILRCLIGLITIVASVSIAYIAFTSPDVPITSWTTVLLFVISLMGLGTGIAVLLRAYAWYSPPGIRAS